MTSFQFAEFHFAGSCVAVVHVQRVALVRLGLGLRSVLGLFTEMCVKVMLKT